MSKISKMTFDAINGAVSIFPAYEKLLLHYGYILAGEYKDHGVELWENVDDCLILLHKLKSRRIEWGVLTEDRVSPDYGEGVNELRDRLEKLYSY